MHRKYLYIILLVVIIMLSIINGYSQRYSIDNDFKNLDEKLSEWFSREDNTSVSFEIYDKVIIDNFTYFAMQKNRELGIVCLKKGLFGKYKIDYISFGSSDISYGIIDSKDRQYIIVSGLNTNLQILEVRFELSNTNQIVIPVEKIQVYISCKQIDNEVDIKKVNLSTLHYYNAKGKDITDNYDLNSACIITNN